MMTSKSEYKLCSLLFETIEGDYHGNLQTLLSLVNEASQNSLIVAPEVCLSGFDYKNHEEAMAFSSLADEAIKQASQGKIIILTMLQKEEDEAFNFVKVYFNGEIVYKRAKAKLFRFGEEHKYMSEGNKDEIEIIEIDGIKIGILICFELRFKEFWQKLEGCDVIAVPSWWGVLRVEHFKTLTRALAIMNQCYVVASDSLHVDCTKMSGIIKPHGEDERNGDRAIFELPYEKKEIQTMRRYMDVGIG